MMRVSCPSIINWRAGPSVSKAAKRTANAVRGEGGKFQKIPPGPKTRTAKASTPVPSTRSVKRRKK